MPQLDTLTIQEKASPLMTPEIQRARQREQDIELLKAVRLATADLCVQCDKYSRQLSVEFLEPLHKVDACLSALLLARELDR